ncbi:competence/damage-inducible protein A [Lacticaseibacillus zhaodongensis]|uniref:competence/damage-inducible protein A n=1 Tax=Lacticaseibacillus zhaodongensis TaxID=2668065 RepID=UPI0012D31140|nr:competence/damage-inducible protein A [Lacticaseibacillus zhaodongensis]
MNAELIAVGTEMLLGEIVNTNGAYLARELSRIGVESYYQQVVGDNPERLDEAISVAEGRSDMIIVMGGLGPTKDDLSKQVLAKHLQLDLVVDEAHLEKLHELARRRQHELTPNNLAQAQLPAGATPLTNHNGLAVGALLKQGAHSYVLLPGPPREFTLMVDRELIPRLAKGQDEYLVSRTLRYFGLGESALVTAIGDIIDQQTNPTVAPYIKDYEVTLRLTARSATKAAAAASLDELTTRIQARIGEYYYATGEQVTLAETVVHALAAQNATVSAAESLTAGAFQAAIGSVAGASKVFAGGFVTYAASAKEQLLGIDPASIAKYGVVSEETAKNMAAGSRRIMNSDYGLGFTGVAGPDELEGNPAGTVWIGISGPQGTSAREFHLSGKRNEVRVRAVKSGLMMLLKQLAKTK